jgi:hypothetical protein
VKHGHYDYEIIFASEENRVRKTLEPSTANVRAQNLVLPRSLEDSVIRRVKLSGKLQPEPCPLLLVPPDCRIDVEAGLRLQKELKFSHRIS